MALVLLPPRSRAGCVGAFGRFQSLLLGLMCVAAVGAVGGVPVRMVSALCGPL